MNAALLLLAAVVALSDAPRIRIPNGFTPRPYQRRAMAYFDNGGTRALTVWHRRGGKDLTALHQTCKMMHKRVGAYWHIFPTAEQGKKAIWEGFTKDGKRTLEEVFPSAIRQSPRVFSPNGEMVVTLKNGSIWRLLGSDKMEVVGAGPVGVVFSEFALAKPRTWDLIRPMLRENGGWAWMITTPRGRNHAKHLFDMARQDPKWFCDLKTLFDTRAYDPEATIAEERASGMPEELIAQEYLCDFNAANVGSFYGTALAALDARGGLAEFEPSGRDNIHTSWDLGKSDDTAIWWWRPTPSGVEILDHYASHGEEVEHYAKVLEDRATEHGWKYRCHWLPHDARAKTLATRQSVVEQMAKHVGAERVRITPNLAFRDGVAASRRLLGVARIHPRCAYVAGNKDCDGIEALRAYHREWDDEKKCFSERPVHDWSSHTADAFRYVAVVVRNELDKMRPPPPAPSRAVYLPPKGLTFQDNPDELYRPSRGGRERI